MPFGRTVCQPLRGSCSALNKENPCTRQRVAPLPYTPRSSNNPASSSTAARKSRQEMLPSTCLLPECGHEERSRVASQLHRVASQLHRVSKATKAGWHQQNHCAQLRPTPASLLHWSHNKPLKPSINLAQNLRPASVTGHHGCGHALQEVAGAARVLWVALARRHASRLVHHHLHHACLFRRRCLGGHT